MMDPVTALTLAGKSKEVLQAAEEAEKFLEQLAGTPGGVSNSVRGDKRQVRRVLKQIELLQRTHADLREKGVNPRMVKWNVVFPLLDAASLEEDPGMAERWAALLANGADPQRDEVPPAFPDILGQMSPLDARVLDFIDQRTPDDPWAEHPEIDEREIRKSLDLGLDAYEVSLDLLIRQSLVRMERSSFDADGLQLWRSPAVTALGKAFIRSCRRGRSTGP